MKKNIKELVPLICDLMAAVSSVVMISIGISEFVDRIKEERV